MRAPRGHYKPSCTTFKPPINPLARTVFLSANYSPTVALSDATKLRLSLGWGSPAWPVQHDVQKFTRVLRDNLESKMRVCALPISRSHNKLAGLSVPGSQGTPGEGAISKLFAGKTKTTVECININCQETVMGEFYGEEYHKGSGIELECDNYFP